MSPAILIWNFKNFLESACLKKWAHRSATSVPMRHVNQDVRICGASLRSFLTFSKAKASIKIVCFG